jgi:hypothetical protein
MRVFLIACLATVILAVGGFFAMAAVQKPSGVAYVTEGARVSPSWSWRQMIRRTRPVPQNASTGMPQGGEALADECGVASSWSFIMVDFSDSPTADPTCEK